MMHVEHIRDPRRTLDSWSLPTQFYDELTDYVCTFFAAEHSDGLRHCLPSDHEP
jgi:hypothetical protein